MLQHLSVSQLALNNFKVSGSDTQQNLFALEQSFHQKGGPPLHRHPNQDEWFYVIEGQFRIRIGAQELTLHPGDSVLAPRNIPHVWAFVGDATGKILVSFAPAGKMEAFFNAISSITPCHRKTLNSGAPTTWNSSARPSRSSRLTPPAKLPMASAPGSGGSPPNP